MFDPSFDELADLADLFHGHGHSIARTAQLNRNRREEHRIIRGFGLPSDVHLSDENWEGE